MTALIKASDSVPATASAVTALVSVDGWSALLAADQHAGLSATQAEGLFDKALRLAVMVLGSPSASVTFAEPGARPGSRSSPAVPQLPGEAGRSLGQQVLDSGSRLIIDDIRMNGHASAAGLTGLIAWAGVPVRDPDGHVVGALCVADRLPRHWTARDLGLLQALADVAGREVALQAALEHGAERAALARTLQESLLPPRLPGIPGLQIAARYAAGGTGAEVLGDFYDIFPSVRGSWGVVVGDVCGKGAPAAKSTALARYTLRAEAHRTSRPSLILAALNRALLDWLTDDPRFLTAIYATVRPTAGGATMQLSSGGHPLALLRRADGRVLTFGRPGTLLGLLPDPDLHDSRRQLRAGDSLILFTDGVTEARGHPGRELYGDDRLRDLVAGLGDMSAARTADAVQQAVMTFSAGGMADDAVSLVLKVPLAAISGGRHLPEPASLLAA